MTTWNELVKQGRDANQQLGQAKFQLGDLADEVETTYNGGQLQTYADEIGVEYNTLRDYRSVARAFDACASDRSKASWSVYRMLAGREDRDDILAERDYWTLNAMRERLGRRKVTYAEADPDEAAHRFRRLDPNQRAELLAESLDDPAVAQAASDAVSAYVAGNDQVRSDANRRYHERIEQETGARQAQPRRAAPDYDGMVERGTNLVSVALAARKAGKWAPSPFAEAFLYFLGRELANQHTPSGGDWEAIIDQIEAYANDQVC